jgi:UDP-glucose 4-epimerase
MKVFITGGAGFIGIHLCKKLLEQNHDVTIFDNFENSSLVHFISIFKDDVTIISGNITNYSKLFHSMKNHDIVVHLAAKISVPDSIINPESTFDTNVNGTQNVLNALLYNKITKIVSLSSAAVYSDTERILDETSITVPSSPYGTSKLEMEKKINQFTVQHKISSTILRLFNVYGSGQSIQYAGVITKFKEKINQNLPLIIYGNGSVLRDFIHVDDVVVAIILAMDSSESNTYNIASGTSTSIINLAKTMITLSDKSFEIVFKSARDGDIISSVSDITLAKTRLQFIPETFLKKGLAQFLSEKY